MNEPRKPYAKGRKPFAKYYILYNSIGMKCPEQADTWRQKVVEWLPRAEGGRKEQK